MPASKNNSRGLIFAKYWLPVIIYAILIFCVSSVPGKDIPPLFPGQDIVFHLIEYGIFALLINRAFKEYYPIQTSIKRFFWVFVLVVLYGITDEFHQSFVPDRSASAFDVVTDGISVFLVHIFYR